MMGRSWGRRKAALLLQNTPALTSRCSPEGALPDAGSPFAPFPLARSPGTRVWERFGITLVKMPRSIGSGSLMLRWWRFRDLLALYTLFRPEVFATASGIARPPFSSCVSFCSWIWTTFPLLYVVQVGASRRRRIVGFVGLYNLDPGRSLHCTLVMFHPADRRCGYGRRTLALLLHALQTHRVVKTVGVEVVKGNGAALRFWQTGGFVVRAQNAETVVLEKPVEEQ